MTDADELRALFFYDPETGLFTRRVRTSNRVKVGDCAGSIDHKGYLKISFLGRQHYAHRLAWLYMTGEWPAGDLDHRNRSKQDNRWCNLRTVDNKTNHENCATPQANNRLGFLGVSRNGSGFGAGITVSGKQVWLGTFRTPEAASVAYFAAKERLHKGYSG